MRLFRVVSFAAACLLYVAGTAHTDQGAECRKVRKVACPAQCNVGEEVKPPTKQCVFSKEQYKKDGVGCVRYDDVCWCGPPCPKESGDIKL